MDFLSSTFNRIVDTLQLVFLALFDLPLTLVIPVTLLAMLALLGLLAVLPKPLKLKKPGSTYRLVLVVTAALMFLFLIDRRFHQLSVEVSAARTAAMMRPPALPSASAAGTGPVRHLFPREAVEEGLPDILGKVTVHVESQNAAVDFVSIHGTEPYHRQLYVAVVDLTAPGLTIHITPSFGKKTLVSEFARSTNSTVAINGEAGRSASRDAELGQWTGNWVVRGRAVQLTDTKDRPFLSFDANNRPTYSPAREVDVELTPEKYNTIWGRFDMLVDGEISIVEGWERSQPYPRTAMGIDKLGQRLFLLVADGKQPGHSVGLSLDDGARILQLFGAHDAMKCDQGGSSCMYLKSRDGIVSRPADRLERRVFTHFGVSVDP